MTTAAARKPTAPAPPGCREPLRAPPPEPCSWCGGDGWEPRDDSIRCALCNWTGAAPLLKWAMARSRAYAVRLASYWPAAGASGRHCELLLETAAREGHRPARERYAVYEVPSDHGGRAFAVAKRGAREAYFVHVGPEWVTCDCAGREYLASAKSNQGAYEAGEETYPTHGCKHADAIAGLLAAGWL